MIFGKEYLPAQTANSLTGLTNVQLPLNFGDIYKKIYIVVKASLTVSTAGANVHFNDYGFYSLLNSIKLKINSNNIFEWTPFMFAYIDQFLTKNQAYSNSLPTAANLQTAGTYPFEMVIPIHLNQPLTSTPSASLLAILQNAGVKDANITLDFNGYNNPFSSATTTIPVYSLNNLSFYILADKAISGSPQTIDGSVKINQFTTKSVAIASAISNQQIALPANKTYRGMVIETLEPSTLVGSDSLISTISVYSGASELIKDLSWVDFKDDYLQHYASPQISSFSNIGRVFLDFAFQEKTLLNAVSTMDNYSTYFKINFAAATTCNFYYWTFA